MVTANSTERRKEALKAFAQWRDGVASGNRSMQRDGLSRLNAVGITCFLIPERGPDDPKNDTKSAA